MESSLYPSLFNHGNLCYYIVIIGVQYIYYIYKESVCMLIFILSEIYEKVNV